MEINLTRKQAEDLLGEHITEPYLLLHSKMVAKVLEAYASKYNADKDLWYITGLLHDIDYQEYPDQHPKISLEWFRTMKLPEELIVAIDHHALGEPKVKLISDLEKVLVASDELSGLIYAYSLMRPTGYEGMESKSVIKKFKDKAFAAKINREEIQYGVDSMGVDLKEHITFLINCFKGQF